MRKTKTLSANEQTALDGLRAAPPRYLCRIGGAPWAAVAIEDALCETDTGPFALALLGLIDLDLFKPLDGDRLGLVRLKDEGED